MYGNGRPLGTRKRFQVLVAVVLLAWATQTLLRQWGFGAELPQDAQGAAPSQSEPAEVFVAAGPRAAPATLELRGEATVFGLEVKLRQVCRWSDSDDRVFAPLGDLVIARIGPKDPFSGVTIGRLKSTLRDAGVNLATINFTGPTSCTVTRSDGDFDEATALRQWAAARGSADVRTGTQDNGTRGQGDKGTEETRQAAVQPVSASSRPRVRPLAAPVSPTSTDPVKTLRSILINDLAIRLGVPEDRLQVNFNPKDEKLLNLSEPLFAFNIQPRRVRDLGEVSWDVLIVTGASSQRASIMANARAWQSQLVIARPLSYHQVIQAEDVSERRVLSDRLPDDPLLNSSQTIGQEAARDLKPGTVVTARLVDAVPLVKPGQTVSISLTVGTVRVKTVGRALESGSFGQAVKVRNDPTRDVFEVTMTGPQEGTMGPPEGVSPVGHGLK